MENLLITGGCGFIGTNLVRYLLSESDFTGRVINLDKLTYAANPASLHPWAEQYGQRYVFVRGDICHAPTVEALLRRYEVDAICHLAAESHVDRSIRGPGPFIQTNIIGSYTLLEVARTWPGLRRFHQVSTDEVYGSLGAEGRFDECSPYRPSSPYSAAKASADHLARAYHTTYGLPLTLSTCSNNYGPYQFPEKLVPLMLLRALRGEPLPLYGDGGQVRDWLYVRDHCTALWRILCRGEPGRTYAVGGGAERKNLALVQTLCDLIDEEIGDNPLKPRRELVSFVADRPGHDRRYAIDSARIRRELGWAPEEDLQSGLRRTIRWYLQHAHWVEQVQSGAYRRWLAEHYGEEFSR